MNKHLLRLADYFLESQEEKERFSRIRGQTLYEYVDKFRVFLINELGYDNENELTPFQTECIDKALEHVTYVFRNVCYDQDNNGDYKYVTIHDLRNRYEKAIGYFKHGIDTKNNVDMQFYNDMNSFDRHGRLHKVKEQYEKLVRGEEYGEDDPSKRYLDDN